MTKEIKTGKFYYEDVILIEDKPVLQFKSENIDDETTYHIWWDDWSYELEDKTIDFSKLDTPNVPVYKEHDIWIIGTINETLGRIFLEDIAFRYGNKTEFRIKKN